MLFNTLEYALFFVVVFALYLALSRRAQNTLLLAASYVFYGAWDWRFLGLILLSTLIDFAIGLALGRVERPGRRRALVAASIVANLGILGGFKYAGFFADGFADLLGLFGVEVRRVAIDVVLPVGISFYTFQTLSYTIDVYRRRFEPTRRLLDFALFVAFFPQLVAGPIERATSLLPQIFRARTLSRREFDSGCWLILWGIFKKVVVADNLAFLVDHVFEPGAPATNVELLLGTYAFVFQLYCDFSGYTDVARGSARLLGFDLMLNFDLPLFATSVADFWRRWHISLGSWIRDYVYIPMGGNRHGSIRTSVNLFVMFVLIGLWHGAAWNFVIFGAYTGALMVAHRALRPLLAGIDPVSAGGRATWWAVRAIGFFHVNCVSFFLFRATSGSLTKAVASLAATPLDPGRAAAWLFPLGVLIAPLLLMEVWQAVSGDHEVVTKSPFWVRTAVYFGVATAIVLLGEDNAIPYVYFQF